MHLTPELYRMALRGEISAEAVLRTLHTHLVESCEGCRKAWEGLDPGDLGPSPPRARALGAPEPGHAEHASQQKIRVQEEKLRRMREERRKARRDLSALLALPADQRRRRIENARARFRSPVFVDLLLSESRERVRNDPATARQLASLVPVALHWMAAGVADPLWRASVCARALALEGNALRVAGDLRGADQRFHYLQAELVRNPVPDSATLAEIASLEASLRNDQRRFEETEELLDRAASLYRDADDPLGVARTRIQSGTLFWKTQRFAEALRHMEAAAAQLDPGEERFLFQCTVSGRVGALCGLDRYDEAEAVLARHRELYRDPDDPYAEVQLLNMEGSIALGQEDYATAGSAFTRCRDGYLRLGRDYDAALATLDLAGALLAEGRTADLRRMAVEVLEIFRARGASHAVLSTLLLLERAVVAEKVTTALLSKAREELKSKAG